MGDLFSEEIGHCAVDPAYNGHQRLQTKRRKKSYQEVCYQEVIRMSQGSLAGDLGRLGRGLFRVLPSSVLLPVRGGGGCCFLGELLLSIMKKMSSWLAVSCMGFYLDLRLL